MKVYILEEHGFTSALLGLSLSYNSSPSKKVADSLVWKDGGHNKFLESMIVWLDIEAPRYWWQQFDTYRVGTTKQSSSTMHTLTRRELTQEDFQGGCHKTILGLLNDHIRGKSFSWVKAHLPESFLQRRVVCTNYKTLQNICTQRATHKLPEWQLFVECLLSDLDHPDYIMKNYKDTFKCISSQQMNITGTPI